MHSLGDLAAVVVSEIKDLENDQPHWDGIARLKNIYTNEKQISVYEDEPIISRKITVDGLVSGFQVERGTILVYKDMLRVFVLSSIYEVDYVNRFR